MTAISWYWVILVLWIIVGVGDIFWDDPRIRRGGGFVLIILLILIGFMVGGSPLK